MQVGEHDDDLRLAVACLDGDPGALRQLETDHLLPVAAHLRALGYSEAAISDARQRAWVRLAVGERDGAPVLADYRGRGPLRAFVRTVMVRIAVDDARTSRRATHGIAQQADVAELLTNAVVDPELGYLRTLYAQHLSDAVRTAWQALAPHDRFVLSLQLHEHMTIDDLAQVYRLHRASAARRAASARASLLDKIRSALRAQLLVGEDTLDSILRIVSTSIRAAPMTPPAH